MTSFTAQMPNNMDTNVPGWAIDGATRAERQRIDWVMGRLLAHSQPSGFNQWQIIKTTETEFIVRRFTWGVWWSRTLDEVLAKIKEAYECYKTL